MSGDSLREAVLAVLLSPVGPSNRHTQTADALVPVIEAFIAAREAAARADEREKAARIAEDESETVGKDFHDCFEPQDAYVDACNDIAAAIRAQKEPTP